MRLFCILFCFWALILPVHADDQSHDFVTFGIHQGQPVDTLNISKKPAANIATLQHAPVSNVNFPQVGVRYHEQTGVCLVVGQTNTIVSSGSGEALKARFDEIEAQLVAQYGEGLVSESIIDGDDELWADHFMTKLSRREAMLATRWMSWRRDKLSDEIAEILLIAQPISSTTANIAMQVKFFNYRECKYHERLEWQRQQAAENGQN